MTSAATLHDGVSEHFDVGLGKFVRDAKSVFEFYDRGAVVAPPLRECDESHWYHRALVLWHVGASACVATLVVCGALASVPRALIAAACVCLGHRAVDPVNGLVHFAIDNYFRSTTPVVGGIVVNFLDHHERPEAISRIQFARNVAGVVALSLPVLAALIVAHATGSVAGLAVTSFLGAFFVETGFSLEAHKYAHMKRESLPPALRWLQRDGWLVSREDHEQHHGPRPGHEAYAAVTGRANRYLTAAALRRVERAVHAFTRRVTGVGIEPRSWRDSTSAECRTGGATRSRSTTA